MTHIVQVVPRIGPGAGIPGVAWHLERELRALGAEVERFTYDDARRGRGRPWPTSTLARRFAHGWRIVLFSTVGTRRARAFLAERPDAVAICHNNAMVGDVYVNHGLVLTNMRARGRSAWRVFRNPFQVFSYARDAIRYRGRTHRAVVALSAAAAAELRAVYRRVRPRIVVIPNGVDLERFRPPTAEERRAARSALGLGEHERVAVFVGHEFARKGLSFAIRALRHAPDVLLLVVGGNRELIAHARREAASAGLADRVHFTGPHPDPLRFLAASDIFVLPSAYEANALVVLEALACGLPVIATRVGYAPEIIMDGSNGFLVARDAEEIGARLDQLAAVDLAPWRVRARASVSEHSWRSIAARYLALADELHAQREAAR
ncbi:glycosyltransferase [Agromyces sp. SYSU T00194]|uniref:glycosyltransferase n=1 Tax=Agromyces chitinivorans TaxID=3158560 RepID=UPI003395CB74